MDHRAGRQCHKTIADTRVLDQVIGDWVKHRWSGDEAGKILREAAARAQQGRAPHEKEVDRLEALRAYWDDKLLNGDCSIERHAPMVAEIEARLKVEREKLAEYGDPAVPDEPEQDVSAQWDAAEDDVKARRELLVLSLRGLRLMVEPGSSRDGYEAVAARMHVTSA